MSEPRTVGEIVDRLPVPRAAVTPMQMLQMAVEKGADLAMLEKLMDLQQRWETNEARKAFVTALNAFKANPPTVIKNKQASFQSKGGQTEYDFATLDQVSVTIGSALAAHGLSHRWEVQQNNGLIKVTCVLTHELGHSERVSLEAGADQSGSKNSIQAIGSTVTYLERYTLLAATGLAAKGQDDDAHGASYVNGNHITPAQKDELIALVKETGADTMRFLTYIGAHSVDEIPVSRFADAKAALEKKRSAK